MGDRAVEITQRQKAEPALGLIAVSSPRVCVRVAILRELLARSPVMPVVTIDNPAWAADLAKAYVNGGLYVIEVTLRATRALQAIESIAALVPEIAIGAGTVCTPADLRMARDAGPRTRCLLGLRQVCWKPG